jgi:glutamyl-Q tRNA(Asp) synthetase
VGRLTEQKKIGNMSPVLRFAPSPNGPLHLGHALSVLTGWAWAQRLGGRFLVRIEDIDPERTTEAYVDAIFRDLEWLGVPWETPVLRQSRRMAVYQDAAERLTRMGLLYPCFASRKEIAAANQVQGGACDPDGAPLYPGLHRLLSEDEISARQQAGEPYVMRLDMMRALAVVAERLGGTQLSFNEYGEGEDAPPQRIICEPARWGDVIIQRKDVPTSYHLSVVVDDAAQGITHVSRGRDLFAATDIHRLLQVLLDLPEPLYGHHRLITDATGRKLAKSARDTSLAELRAVGMTPTDVRRLVGLF